MRHRALAERLASSGSGARAPAVVARATTELAGAPVAGLRERFLRRVLELASEPHEAAAEGSTGDATTLFGADVFQRAAARWRELEGRLVALPVADFDFFVARFQARTTHTELATRGGEPVQGVAARERAWLERLRRSLAGGEPTA